MNIQDYLTHIDNPEDLDYLRKKAPDVNMRLFINNEEYRNIIYNITNYLGTLASTTFKGYKKPHGMSGANAAIPFNIIAIVKNRKSDKEFVEILINPKIISQSKETFKSKSNCGSIRLKEPIEISRAEIITVEYYDLNGNKHKENFNRENGCATIAHEIDHNNGILITDLI